MVTDTKTGKDQNQPGVVLKHVLRSASVVGFAIINDDLYVNNEDASQPNADSWFHLACTTETARPHILAREQKDGIIECYPARRAGKRYRVCPPTPNGTYMNFNEMTRLDGKIIEAAIKRFVSTL